MSAPAAAAPAPVPPPSSGAAGGQQQVVYYVYQMQAPGAAESQAMDWSVCFTFYFLRTALNFLNIASWVIFLAGICKAQANCNSGKFDSGLNYPFPGAGWGQAPTYLTGPYDLTSGDCGTIYGLTWWSVWLQFAAVVVATITSISMFTKSKTVRSIFTTTMYFFIMSSVLLFFIANEFITETWILNKKIDNNGSSWNSWIAATTLLSVGSIASLICNFIWIIWNSYGDIPAAATTKPTKAAHDGDAFVAPADDKHATPVATTTTPTVTVASA